MSRQNSMDFPELLEKVQGYMSEQYKELLSGEGNDRKDMLISAIRQFLMDNRLSVDGMNPEQLTNRLYREMAEYSFLTPYLNYEISNVEGIEINSWDCIWVKFAGSRMEPAKGQFLSPKHARDVLTRLLHQSKINMDYACPLVRGHLDKNIRITVNGGFETLDDDVGIAASIRFVNPNHLKKEDLIKFGTLTPEMMEFLIALYRYGISLMLAGETDAGKTTLMAIIMAAAVLYSKKLYTIENGTREFDLIVRDTADRILNSVIHTVTRESEDLKQAITQQMLLEQGMTMNPDYICMAEVKGSEAFETIEAALTGHPVIGTTHTDSAETIPDRLVQLASIKGTTLSDKTLYSMAVKAFPILFYSEKMADGVRRVTQICECTLENDRPKVTPLWRYDTKYNEVVNGKTVIHGEFIKCGTISVQMQKRLRRKGIPEDLLQSFLKGGQEK
ncbi:type II/IV secretion system ATPase subunit [Caproiciproducens sp. AGMB10547]|uniref:Type II/IV secretion system ATPase subunit n=2 Tax=Caproiciproducens faecalis TaxID=2820301 RepID=A0ABS7DPI1_9FIRM|nr:type II/IV secretion system ATPase subunit [Caproiciproducens faecalis]